MTTYLNTVCARLVPSGTMAPRTLEDYRSKTQPWIIPLLGKHRLDRLLPEHLDAAYQVMYERGLSSSTVLKIHRILSRALKIAVRRDKVARNVAALIDAPSPTDTELEPFDREEARRILATASKLPRNSTRWSVALALGIRQGEALGLRWSYVDLKTGVIKAWFQIQRAPWRHGCKDPHACGANYHRMQCPKDCESHAHVCPKRQGGEWVFRRRKGKNALTLQCPPELLTDLEAHRKAQNAERLRAKD